MPKYIVFVGSVISGCGKGVSASSLGLLMKMRGHNVQLIKFDPYLNINAGILSPVEHGELSLLEDGTEADLDLSNYERITGITMTKDNICTSGTIYKELIEDQENGKHLGKTIQITPHFTDKVIDRLKKLGENAEIVFAEIGGTVGDAESGGFLEAIRQLKQDHDVLVVMVAPVLWFDIIQEFKTKPLQNGVKELQRSGIQPDILLCRSPRPVPAKLFKKIANLTGIKEDQIFECPDIPSVYLVPIEFYSRHLDDLVADLLHLKRSSCRIQKYRDLVEKYINGKDLPTKNIGIIGKYENKHEAYISLREALYHAGVNNNVRVNIQWIKAEDLEKENDIKKFLTTENGNLIDGVIVPGGFDARGVEGKIKSIQFCRENKIPFLGICLGLQCAVIEFLRNVCQIEDANSMEFDKKCKNPVIHFVPGQENLTKKVGNMRLGAYDCELLKDSLIFGLYKKKSISERHRHRFEVNEKYVEHLENKGFTVSGRNPESNLVEMMELKDHPYFVGTQAHPEFKSRLGNPAPLFDGLIKATLKI